MALKYKVDLTDSEDLSADGIPYVLTQAGCYANEDNDCALVALALATDLPYHLIHDIARTCLGRKDKDSTLNMHYAARYYPFSIRKVSNGGFRLWQIVDKFPKGKYYVQIGGQRVKSFASKRWPSYNIGCHALALRDGKIYDRHFESPDRWVKGVWKITGMKPASWRGWRG